MLFPIQDLGPDAADLVAGDDAGIEHINPHRFRHTFAHEAKSRGMSDGDLMVIAGWQSPQMLHRYGASAAADRARDSHRRLFGKD